MSRVTLLTWNLAFGYGIGSEGAAGYRQRPRAHFERAIDRIAAVIAESGADVVLLQEIDFGGKRVGGMDQLAALLARVPLPHASRALSWDAPYVPHPLWPPRDHFGRVISGSAVLSRFPILEERVEFLPRAKEHSWWKRPFYPHRYLHWARIAFPGSAPAWVINLHLEAFGQGTRERQAEVLAARLRDEGHDVLAAGGDFNTVPPEAKRKSGYADHTDDRYEGDRTLAVLREVEGFREAVGIQEYAQGEGRYFTFPADLPNRRLDYFFVRRDLRVTEASVVPAGPVSDHLPFRIGIEYP